MAAPQGWSRWYDDAPEHPKFLAAGHKAGWLYVCGQAYCSRQATDGLIPKTIVPRLSDVPSPGKVAAQLVEVGLWHDEGDYYRQHDYCEMQTTAAEREEKREVKRAAGGKGNHTKWHADRGMVDPDCEWCRDSHPPPDSDRETLAPASPTRSQRDSPESEADTEGEKKTPSRPDPPAEPDVSDDARALTRLLAQRVKANGFKIPSPGQKNHRQWLTDADRMIRIDGVEVDEAKKVCEWATSDEFWMTNIQSMPKFREKYPQLRLKWLNTSKPPASKQDPIAARYGAGAR